MSWCGGLALTPLPGPRPLLVMLSLMSWSGCPGRIGHSGGSCRDQPCLTTGRDRVAAHGHTVSDRLWHLNQVTGSNLLAPVLQALLVFLPDATLAGTSPLCSLHSDAVQPPPPSLLRGWSGSTPNPDFIMDHGLTRPPKTARFNLMPLPPGISSGARSQHRLASPGPSAASPSIPAPVTN